MLELAGQKCYERMIFNVEGAVMTRNSNQATPSKLSIIRQLEYCRLYRAAELLGCDISDLVHFGVTERLDIYILLHDQPTASVTFPKYTDAFPNHEDQLDDGRFIFNQHTYMRPFSLGLKKPTRYDKRLHDELRAVLFGLWKLPPYIIQDIENHNLPDLDYIRIRISAVTNEGDFAYADLMDWNCPPSIDDMYIKQSDMMRVYEALGDSKNEKPLLRCEKSLTEQEAQARPIENMSTSHLQTERHAANREIILSAAIYAQNHWPEECGETAKGWARAVCDHEHELFRDTNNGKAPLSEQKIERILGSAINKGAPYKSK